MKAIRISNKILHYELKDYVQGMEHQLKYVQTNILLFMVRMRARVLARIEAPIRKMSYFLLFNVYLNFSHHSYTTLS